MEHITLTNKKGLHVSVIVEVGSQQKGLAFIMHGLGGFKEQVHIETFAQAFREQGFTVVRFDTTNSFGESDGNYEDATVTNYYSDLEDVINWARTKTWFEEPFALCGHSLGGMCTLLYAQKYPEQVKALAPIATTISGELSLQTERYKQAAPEWERTGWHEEPSESRPGTIKRLKWSHMEDRMKYDVLKDVAKLTMPVFLLVGDKDESTPLEHQQILFEALPGPKELHIVKGAQHTYREPEHLRQVRELLSSWVENIQNKSWKMVIK